MVFDPFSTAGGGASGLIAAWIILKTKLNGLGKRLTKVEDGGMKKEMCEVLRNGIDDKLGAIKESQGEIKTAVTGINNTLADILRRPCQKPGEGCDK